MIGYGGFGMANAMFTIVPIFIGVVFVLILAGIAVQAVRGAAPVEAEQRRPGADSGGGGGGQAHGRAHLPPPGGLSTAGRHASSRTIHYATFPGGERGPVELEAADMEYCLLVEGDRGRLTFQGTRFQGFRRT